MHNKFVAEFGPTEMLQALALMARLLDAGFEFDVRDDRGGSGTWRVETHTSASVRVLPPDAHWQAFSVN